MIPWYYKAIAAFGLVAAIFGGGWYVGRHGATLKAIAQIAAIHEADAQALAKAEAAARAKEQSDADRMAVIEQTYKQEQADAKAKSDRVIADLKSGALRLRKEWQCPSDHGVPEAGNGVTESDAGAQLRAEDASDLVRLAAEADAEIRALQQVIRQDRSN